MDSPYIKVHHVLPNEVLVAIKAIDPTDREARDSYITELRHRHWSLQSIGDGFSMTRERVRQIVNETRWVESYTIDNDKKYPKPYPPLRPVKEPRVTPELSNKSLERLLKLQPSAQLVRSHSPKYRKEAEEYTELMFKEYSENGVPLAKIADALGITSPAIRFRFARYGYVSSPKGANNCYKPILKKNRYTLNS